MWRRQYRRAGLATKRFVKDIWGNPGKTWWKPEIKDSGYGETWMQLWNTLDAGSANWWLTECGYEGKGTIRDGTGDSGLSKKVTVVIHGDQGEKWRTRGERK